MKAENVKVYCTKDYGRFNFLKGLNRAEKPSHTRNLVKSIERKNLLKDNPLIVDKKFNIFDGQHRLLAAKILDIDIYYVFAREMVQDDIPILNVNSLKWTPREFMEKYISQGNKNYKQFKKFMITYNLPSVNGALSFFRGLGGHTSNIFNLGDFMYPKDDTISTQGI